MHCVAASYLTGLGRAFANKFNNFTDCNGHKFREAVFPCSLVFNGGRGTAIWESRSALMFAVLVWKNSLRDSAS